MPLRLHSLTRPLHFGAAHTPAAPSAALCTSVSPAAVTPAQAAAHPSPLGDVRAPHPPAATLQADTRAAVHAVSAEPSCAVGGCRALRHHGSRAHFCAYHDTKFKNRVYELAHDVGRGAL